MLLGRTSLAGSCANAVRLCGQNARIANNPARFVLAGSALAHHCNPLRSKVILPKAHPFEYFRDSWPTNTSASTSSNHTATTTNTSQLPEIPHPRVEPHPDGRPRPLYYKITLRRSLLGLPWHRKYLAGVLFRKYPPSKRYRPTIANARISTNTVIFREASAEVADLVVQLKEILLVENVWTVEEYRRTVKALLGKRALTARELQDRRGYFLVENVLERQLQQQQKAVVPPSQSHHKLQQQ